MATKRACLEREIVDLRNEIRTEAEPPNTHWEWYVGAWLDL